MNRVGALVGAVAISAVVLTGCSRDIAGTPVTDANAADTVTVTGAGAAERVSGLDRVTCQQLVPGTGGTECLVKPAITTSSAKAVSLRAGDPVAFTRTDRTSVVSVGAFVRDSAGSTYAVVGSPVPRAKAGDSMTATDGTPLGTTVTTLVTTVPGESWAVAVVKLDKTVGAVSSISGAGSTPEYVPVTVSGAGTTTPLSGSLIHGGDTFYFPVPSLRPGDNGGPVVSDGKLVGMVSLTSGSVAAWSKIAPRLSEVGTVHLFTQ